ncbi:S41 family peptidase [candidate division WOR-3 bacterium]|nr:S41 family peptidase [candidate division WOR-3 bacterium]
MMRRVALFICLGIIVVLLIGAAENISYNLNMFSNILRIVRDRYVEEIDLSDLIKKAISGMLYSLDPHSSYLEEDDYRDLQVKTQGKFGGLGIQISIRNGWLTIIAPIEGTPAYRAGLRPGDIISKIEGESTRGITTDKAVKKLRGTPGTIVTITIAREGMEETDYTIERATIEIMDVPYYGLLTENIGYIKLVNFSNGAVVEVRNALDELHNMGAIKFILDLTNNPGGLLNEAVKVSDLFIGKDSLIVSTKGRMPNANREYRAMNKAHYGRYPLVILVNGASASASEIVAGAVQDWSRGIIIGDTTFGKGSVQTIVPLSATEALKLTTARYYTPSGRCIHKSDTLRFLLKNPTDENEFRTLREPIRTLYGGGGIFPDIYVKTEKTPQLVWQIWRKGGFLSFAAHFTRLNPELKRNFTLKEEIYDEFKTYLKEEKELEISDQDWDEAIPFMERYLRASIAESLWGTTGRYEESYLVYDHFVAKAKEVLFSVSTVEELFAEIDNANNKH